MYRTLFVLAVVALCVVLAHSSAKMLIQIKDLDDLNTRLTEAGEKLVVINFMTTWCEPCKTLDPELHEISTERADTTVVLNVDIEKCPRIKEKFNIIATPQCVFLKSSKKVYEFTGADVNVLTYTVNKLK